MSCDMVVQAFDGGGAAPMPSSAFDVFRPHVDRTQPEHHFWHLRTPDGGEADIYADVTPGTFGSLTISRFSPGDPLGLLAEFTDSYLGSGVFFRLRLLRPGDLVYVRRANGTLAVFRVYAEHMYAKAHFPTQRVYGPKPDAELHLITCGGVFDSATSHYLSNVVVHSSEIRVNAPRRHHHGWHPHQPRARR